MPAEVTEDAHRAAIALFKQNGVEDPSDDMVTVAIERFLAVSLQNAGDPVSSLQYTIGRAFGSP